MFIISRLAVFTFACGHSPDWVVRRQNYIYAYHNDHEFGLRRGRRRRPRLRENHQRPVRDGGSGKTYGGEKTKRGKVKNRDREFSETVRAKGKELRDYTYL